MVDRILLKPTKHGGYSRKGRAFYTHTSNIAKPQIEVIRPAFSRALLVSVLPLLYDAALLNLS